MKRRSDALAGTEPAEAATARPASHGLDGTGHASPVERHSLPRNLAEAEERYVAARDAWTRAMRDANSGRPADLAALALAQESFEAAVAERDRWRAAPNVAIPVDPEDRRRDVEAIVGQELAWRRMREEDQARARRRGLLGRLFGRKSRG